MNISLAQNVAFSATALACVAGVIASIYGAARCKKRRCVYAFVAVVMAYVSTIYIMAALWSFGVIDATFFRSGVYTSISMLLMACVVSWLIATEALNEC